MIINLSGNKFAMPDDSSIPIIMIGTGTGIAPYRSFWQERQRCIEQNTNKVFGEFILFYGCRNKQKDFLFKNEIESLTQKKVLTECHVAFSRDPNYPKVSCIFDMNFYL